MRPEGCNLTATELHLLAIRKAMELFSLRLPFPVLLLLLLCSFFEVLHLSLIHIS